MARKQGDPTFRNAIANVSNAFAAISEKAAKAANLEKMRIAKGNIRAAEAQIELEATTQRRAISRAFAQHQGTVAAQAGYRGGGAATATERSAATAASEQVATVMANASAKVGAVTAQQIPILEDPFLAKLEGGLRGREIGSSIAKSLIEEAEVFQRTSFHDLGAIPGISGARQGEKVVSLFADIKGFDLSSILNI